ncbi:hypothetical protein JL720_16399 [Aureococcus anophagefferens]|nr:hypothetical protein JL720_16399 [Aureococcus anophagefferens]
MFTSANCAVPELDAVTFAERQTVDGAALDAVLGGTAGAEFGDALCAGFANVSANATGLNATGLNATGANQGSKRAKFPTSKAHISADFHSFRLTFDERSSSERSRSAYASYALAYLENLTAVPDDPGDDDGDGGGDDSHREAGLCLAAAARRADGR